MTERLSTISIRTRPMEIDLDGAAQAPYNIQATTGLAFSESSNSGKWTRLTKNNGRSAVDRRINDKVLFSDKYKIQFGTISRKGVDTSRLAPREDHNYQNGVRINGLMDDIGLTEGIIASDHFRKNGIQTECVLQAEEILELPTRSGVVEIADWKEGIVKQMRDVNNPLTQQLKSYFDSTRFIAVTRALQVGERIEDIQGDSLEQTIRLIRPVFRWIDACYKVNGQKTLPRIPMDLDFSGNMTVEKAWKYLSMWLPMQMGTTLGKIHGLGYIHGYPHFQNFSGTGGLYDLDSVDGQLTTGRIPPMSEFAREIESLHTRFCFSYWAWANYTLIGNPKVEMLDVLNYGYFTALTRGRLNKPCGDLSESDIRDACGDLLKMIYKKQFIDEVVDLACNPENANPEFAIRRRS